jgi:hypothetical protein
MARFRRWIGTPLRDDAVFSTAVRRSDTRPCLAVLVASENRPIKREVEEFSEVIP